MGRRQRHLGLDRLPLSNRGRTVDVFQTGASYRTGQADADPEVLRGVKGALGIRSILAAPIQTDGACRGVFEVTCAQPDRFAVEDLRFIESVARWVARRASPTWTACSCSNSRVRSPTVVNKVFC